VPTPVDHTAAAVTRALSHQEDLYWEFLLPVLQQIEDELELELERECESERESERERERAELKVQEQVQAFEELKQQYDTTMGGLQECMTEREELQKQQKLLRAELEEAEWWVEKLATDSQAKLEAVQRLRVEEMTKAVSAHTARTKEEIAKAVTEAVTVAVTAQEVLHKEGLDAQIAHGVEEAVLEIERALYELPPLMHLQPMESKPKSTAATAAATAAELKLKKHTTKQSLKSKQPSSSWGILNKLVGSSSPTLNTRNIIVSQP
jgi:hypothetical protein